MWGVIGLGNPGPRYAETRHNLGFMVVDELLLRRGARTRGGRGSYAAAEVDLAGVRVVLVKPTTYVNRTGIAARAVLERFDVPVAQLLAVVDDVYLPFGRIRLRPCGSAGGHNGLQSIEDHLQTRGYPRLRLGLGAPAGRADLADHVLATFSDDEREALPDFIQRAANAVERIVELGLEHARPVVNAAPPPETGE
ncbi:MAG: aminoacyl-tRNA hydrolase [Candidatus Krumholzibacteriia bacterium]